MTHRRNSPQGIKDGIQERKDKRKEKEGLGRLMKYHMDRNADQWKQLRLITEYAMNPAQPSFN